MSNEEMKKVAEMTAKIVVKELRGSTLPSSDEDLVDSKEAARILGITPNYLRIIKDRFPHVKVGGKQQGRILFRKAELLVNYTKGMQR